MKEHVSSRDRRRADHMTKETAYSMFKAGSSGLDEDAPVNGTPTPSSSHRAQDTTGRRPLVVGSFRITSAAYDSRFVDMALAAEWRRRTTSHNCAAGAAGERSGVDRSDDVEYYDDPDNDDDDDNSRAASVSKCLHWLRTQHCQSIAYR